MSIPTRMIDANALQRHFEDMQRYDPCAANFMDHRGEPSTNWYCVEDALENAPTVQAIPVEWITEQECGEDEVLSVAANAVLKAWLTREDEA